MGYHLGVDIGTTYTAAAVWRDGRVEIANLGLRASVIPSVVFLKEDDSVLTGDAANRRGVTQPGRLAREFKRRLGDTTPIFLGGSPHSADALIAKLLRWVVDAVTVVEGGPPASIAVVHPANWGPFKLDLLRQAVERADLNDVTVLTEPEGAAIYYASLSRLEPGSIIAVFDLGGGTFDAAVLRRTEVGFEILGEPQGIERLGGVDFDEAVFQHAVTAIGPPVATLDHDDPVTVAALARLRQACVEAKEALSSDTEVAIPVLLPSVHTEVRLTRSEFEDMIRPALGDTIVALLRTLRLAGVGTDEVTAVLLVGGSSRIPLVSELVGGQLGRPVAVDVHPKHGVALGAAISAAEVAQAGAARITRVVEPVEADEAAEHPIAASTPPPAPTAGELPRVRRDPRPAETAPDLGDDGPAPRAQPSPAPGLSPTAIAPLPSGPPLRRRRRLLSSRNVLVAVGTVAAIVVTTLFMTRDGSGRATRTVEVDSRFPWTDTGLVLEGGEEVRFSASGSISDDLTRPDQRFEPDGSPREPNDRHAKDPWVEFPHAALLGRIGAPKEQPFLVGRDLKIADAPAGALFLRVNDSVLEDNEGTLTVEIEVRT